MGTAGIAMVLSLRVGGDGTVSPGRWGTDSAPEPAGYALGGWVLTSPLIVTSDPEKQDSCDSLNAGQQEEVKVHVAVVDVP